jgi:hypothetical protein
MWVVCEIAWRNIDSDPSLWMSIIVPASTELQFACTLERSIFTVLLALFCSTSQKSEESWTLWSSANGPMLQRHAVSGKGRVSWHATGLVVGAEPDATKGLVSLNLQAFGSNEALRASTYQRHPSHILKGAYAPASSSAASLVGALCCLFRCRYGVCCISYLIGSSIACSLNEHNIVLV